MNDADIQALWRAGSLRGWVRALIAFACVLSVALALVGTHLMWRQRLPAPVWVHQLPCAVLVGIVALAAIAPGRTSAWIRIAMALPVAQIAAMLSGWRVWHVYDGAIAPVTLDHALPLGTAILGLGLAYALVTMAITKRERLHAGVMLALANLVLLGLWLPIATRLWCREIVDYGDVDRHLVTLVIACVVPPLVAAIAFTALRFRRKRMPRVHGGLGLLFAFALVASFARRPIHDYALSQFLHVILAAGVLAVVAISVLAASLALDGWRGRRRLAGRRLAGVIRCDEPAAAAVSIASWLRGPRQILAPFAIATPDGDVPIPGGARWVGPLPSATTLLRRGEAAVVLRAGDAVVASGFVTPDASHPFRSSRAWIPGDGEIWIGRVEDAHTPADVGLALWRPSVAYLAIVIAIGVPAFVAALCAL